MKDCQVQERAEGPEGVERWPEKLRRMARYFGIKPNELANRMIAAGIAALEREDPNFEPDFVMNTGKRSSSQDLAIPEREETRRSL